MSEHSEILVTTTSHIEGYKIQTYFGVVTAQEFIILDALEELTAGSKQVADERIAKYEKHVDFVNNQLIKKLKEKSKILGGNAILGLQLNSEEITYTKGKLLLMMASGTAVKVFRLHCEELDKMGRIQADIITYEEISVNLLDATNKKLTQEDWDLLIKYHQFNKTDDILSTLHSIYSSKSTAPSKYGLYTKNAMSFFLNMDKEVTKIILYGAFKKYSSLNHFLTEALKAGKLFDLYYITDLLNSSILDFRIIAMNLLGLYKDYYTYDDIKTLEKVIEKLKISFPALPSMLVKKELTHQNVRVCYFCGSKNKEGVKYCSNEKCRRDKRGLKRSDKSPEMIIDLLEKEIFILKDKFEKK